MGYGNGISVTPRKDSHGEIIRGKWFVQVSLGFDGKGGRIRKSCVVSGTKAEAFKRGEQLKREFDMGIDPNADKITFAQFAKKWHANRVEAGELRSRALEREASRIKRLCGELGNYQLKQITPSAIEAAYSAIKTHPKDPGRTEPLSGTTMNGIHRLLSQIMKAAVNNDFILRNPCERVKAPKKDTKEKEYLSQEEAARLTATLNQSEKVAYSQLQEKENRMHAAGKRYSRSSVYGIKELSCLMAVRLALTTGARGSEVFGLAWENVAADCSSIEIKQTLTVQGKIEPPKTEKSNRAISLDKVTARHLKRWRDVQGALLRTLGIKNLAAAPVCCSNTGSWFRRMNFIHWLHAWNEKNGFSFTMHTLRHTHATLLLGEPGITVKQVQKRLGHSSATTTWDTYGHFIEDKDDEAAEVFGAILSAKTA